MTTSCYLFSLLLVVAVVIQQTSAVLGPGPYKVTFKKWQCKPWEWACNNGWQCIKLHLACDRYSKVHCNDRSDESARNCVWEYPGNRCGRGLFSCRNGKCITWAKVCDDGGDNDCGNNRDERNSIHCLKARASRRDKKARTVINECKENIQFCQRHPRQCGLKTPFNCRKIYRPNRPLSEKRPWALDRPWEKRN